MSSFRQEEKQKSKWPLVNIIILNWNGNEVTLNCLHSIEKMNYPNYLVTLVDNGSTDRSLEAVQIAYPDTPWLTIVENGRNLGFAAGNNAGIRLFLSQGADYCWILNNDTVVEPDSLMKLVQTAIDHPRAGVLGPKVLCDPDRHLVYSKGERFSLWFNWRTIDIGEEDRKREVSSRTVDYVVGCAMLVSRKFLDHVGMLDEKFFAYYEEVDWCLRGKKAGFDIRYVPQAVIYHKGGASTGGSFSRTATYYRMRNWIYLMRKHAAFYHWFTFLPVFTYVFMRCLVVAGWRRDLRGMAALFQAVMWHFRGGRGRTSDTGSIVRE